MFFSRSTEPLDELIKTKRVPILKHSQRRTVSLQIVCAKTACCSHLRLTWQVLTVLTVLCVALQLLGVVRQAEYTKIIGPADDLKSISTTLDSLQRDDQLFQWTDGKNFDTTPARRLASTINRMLVANGDQLAGKTSLPRDPKDEPWVYPEVVNQSSAQSPNSEDMLRRSPEVPLNELDKLQQLDSYGIYTDSNKQAMNVLSQDESGMCRPKHHIVFLKTHKTASSTILNMLYRYGDTRNLTFALPVNMYSQLYYPHYFMSHFVEGTKFHRVTEFHIMCNHMRFQGLEVRKVMPVDTFYFSILRNPVSMMESIFTYYKSIPAFRYYQSLTQFLLDGVWSFNASLPNNHYARNILTFDFGMDSSPPANEAELEKHSADLIATVESNFHLILISEYFDESMILLKHTLCWTLEDVVSFRLNSRNEKSRSQLSPESAELVKRWSSLDWRLYNHFNATFWRRIDTVLGRAKLQEEVELLRARRAELEQTCLLGGGAVDPDKVQDKSLKPFQYGSAVIQGYNIRPGLDSETHGLCQRLITPELQYTRALYTKQFPDLAAKFQTAAKMSTSQRLAARRTITTTRHSALKQNLQTRTAAVHNMNSKSNTNVHLQKLDSVHYAHERTLTRSSSVIKNNANIAVQQSIDAQSDPSKYSAIENNLPTQT